MLNVDLESTTRLLLSLFVVFVLVLIFVDIQAHAGQDLFRIPNEPTSIEELISQGWLSLRPVTIPIQLNDEDEIILDFLESRAPRSRILSEPRPTIQLTGVKILDPSTERPFTVLSNSNTFVPPISGLYFLEVTAEITASILDVDGIPQITVLEFSDQKGISILPWCADIEEGDIQSFVLDPFASGTNFITGDEVYPSIPGNVTSRNEAKINIIGIFPSEVYFAAYIDLDEELENNGGHAHEHHTGDRPLGSFSRTNPDKLTVFFGGGRDVGNGFSLSTTSYFAGEFGGYENIIIMASDVPFVAESLPDATLQDQLAIRDELRNNEPEGEEIIAYDPARGCLIGQIRLNISTFPRLLPLGPPNATSPGIYTRRGGTREHRGPGPPVNSSTDDNHYGQDVLNIEIGFLASLFHNKTGRALLVNDMSLPFGGTFDVCGTWNPRDRCGSNNGTKGHTRKYGHFFGGAVDLNLRRGFRAIDKKRITTILKFHMNYQPKSPSSTPSFVSKTYFVEGNRNNVSKQHIHIMRGVK